jgi:hypothetical protein
MAAGAGAGREMRRSTGGVGASAASTAAKCVQGDVQVGVDSQSKRSMTPRGCRKAAATGCRPVVSAHLDPGGLDVNCRVDVCADAPMRMAPGDEDIPHDMLHFVVEDQAGLKLDYGQAAAGGEVGGYLGATARLCSPSPTTCPRGGYSWPRPTVRVRPATRWVFVLTRISLACN